MAPRYNINLFHIFVSFCRDRMKNMIKKREANLHASTLIYYRKLIITSINSPLEGQSMFSFFFIQLTDPKVFQLLVLGDSPGILIPSV